MFSTWATNKRDTVDYNSSPGLVGSSRTSVKNGDGAFVSPEVAVVVSFFDCCWAYSSPFHL